MSQLNGHAEFARVVADNYTEMESQLNDCMDANRQLAVDNSSLVAEVTMLRDALARSDRDRLRQTAIASTLTGQLLAINAVIGDAVRMAAKNGIEAEQAPVEAAEPAHAPNPHDIVQPTMRAEGYGLPPQVDWVEDGLRKERFGT